MLFVTCSQPRSPCLLFQGWLGASAANPAGLVLTPASTQYTLAPVVVLQFPLHRRCFGTTSEDAHVQLHAHLDSALECMDHIQHLEDAESVSYLRETDKGFKMPALKSGPKSKTKSSTKSHEEYSESISERIAELKKKGKEKLDKLRAYVKGKTNASFDSVAPQTAHTQRPNMYLVSERA